MAAGDDSANDAGRDFERWALAGVAAVMAVALAVVVLRADGPEGDAPPVHDPGALVRVRIGGPGAAADPRPGAGGEGPRTRVEPPPAEPPAPPVEPEPRPPEITERTYVVQKGETLSEIARRELGSVRRLHEIVELNGIRDPDAIRAGDRLSLPAR